MATDPMMTDSQGPVLTCKAMDCSYNKDECCYASKIEVGDEHPTCDTYTHNASPQQSTMSIVATCHVDDCYFNQSEACHAAGITVSMHQGHADCYTARMQ